MSEREDWEDYADSWEEYTNYEVILNVSDGSEILVNRYNTTLYTFFGSLATRNHVFIVTGENEDNSVSGFGVFAHAPIYEQLVERVVAYDFPMELNKTEVSEGDEAMFQRSLEKMSGDVPDTIPEEWL